MGATDSPLVGTQSSFHLHRQRLTNPALDHTSLTLARARLLGVPSSTNVRGTCFHKIYSADSPKRERAEPDIHGGNVRQGPEDTQSSMEAGLDAVEEDVERKRVGKNPFDQKFTALVSA